ncbi:hypothetical protein MY1884_004796 [Beauveria asiatica]
MSSKESTVSNANKGKVSYELLLRIIHQLKQGKSINWSGIKMKDRNTKSLTNQWTKIGKDMAALEDLEGDAVSAAPTPKKGGAAKRKMTAKNEDGDEALETPVKKRGRVAAVKKDANVKKEDDGEEDDMMKIEH